MRQLHYGDRGPDVTALQTHLIALGYALPQFGIDGVYGAETEEAAKWCCKDRHWDYCSWGPCPEWVQQWIADAVPTPTAWQPSGRGMFIQSMNAVTPDEARAVIEHVGLSWVCVQAVWQYPGSKSSNTYNSPETFGLPHSYGCTANARAVVDLMLEAGLDVVPFGYPVPGKDAEMVHVLAQYADLWESPSVVIDPEVEWYGQESAARELAGAMTAAFPSWGVTSYGAPWYHRTFPFAAFTRATYAMPQTYGVQTFGTLEGYSRARDEWLAYGYRTLVGLYGTYSKTDAQMRQLLTVAASFDPAATCGWKWATTSDAEWEHVRNTL